MNEVLHPDGKGFVQVLVPSGKTRFQFWYNEHHFEVYSDTITLQGGHVAVVEVAFENAMAEVISDKPVIYVYPEATQHVNIQLNVQGQLSFTYPAYSNGWDFTAHEDGSIHMNGKAYDYLFWDAKHKLNRNSIDMTSGFIVARDSLVPFFERQLSAMNLSPREQQDFITYWCPRMIANERSFVQFAFNEDYDQFAGITITPKPDHIFRVMMIWQDAKHMNAATVHAQEIQSVTREGFTIVEWGGTEIPVVSTEL
jgi:hypothetical protein